MTDEKINFTNVTLSYDDEALKQSIRAAYQHFTLEQLMATNTGYSYVESALENALLEARLTREVTLELAIEKKQESK